MPNWGNDIHLAVTSKTITVRLQPTPAQQEALDATLATFAQACETAMHVGHQAGTTSNAVIHRLCYRQLRTDFDLSANLAIRAIARAARQLKEASATTDASTMDYDARTLSVSDDGRSVSLSTVRGRLQEIPLRLNSERARWLRSGRLVRAVLHRDRDHQYRLAISFARVQETPPL